MFYFAMTLCVRGTFSIKIPGFDPVFGPTHSNVHCLRQSSVFVHRSSTLIDLSRMLHQLTQERCRSLCTAPILIGWRLRRTQPLLCRRARRLCGRVQAPPRGSRTQTTLPIRDLSVLRRLVLRRVAAPPRGSRTQTTLPIRDRSVPRRVSEIATAPVR